MEGCGVLSDQPFRVGQMVSAELGDQLVTVDARVIHSEVASGSRWCYGLSFVHLTAKQRGRIRELWVAIQQEEARRTGPLDLE